MEQVIDFIVSNYIWFLIGLGVIILAIIGYIAEKTGKIGKKKVQVEIDDSELVDFSDISKPKEEDKEEKTHEEDISDSFDTLPDIEKEETEEKTDEDLYAPFGDQEVKPKEEEIEKPLDRVEEVEDDNYTQEFVDINKIENEAVDIINKEDKKDLDDLMEDQFDMDFGLEEEKKEKKKKEVKEEKKKEEDEVSDMWKF